MTSVHASVNQFRFSVLVFSTFPAAAYWLKNDSFIEQQWMASSRPFTKQSNDRNASLRSLLFLRSPLPPAVSESQTAINNQFRHRYPAKWQRAVGRRSPSVPSRFLRSRSPRHRPHNNPIKNFTCFHFVIKAIQARLRDILSTAAGCRAVLSPVLFQPAAALRGGIFCSDATQLASDTVAAIEFKRIDLNKFSGKMILPEIWSGIAVLVFAIASRRNFHRRSDFLCGYWAVVCVWLASRFRAGNPRSSRTRLFSRCKLNEENYNRRQSAHC